MSTVRDPGYEADHTIPVMRDWTRALHTHRQARERSSQRIKDITEACKSAHGKKHVVECPECYGKVVDELRSRYLESGALGNGSAGAGAERSREWFDGREKFLAELERMFVEAREFGIRLEDIEKRIRREKSAWYRDVLRRYPYFLEVAMNSATGERFEKLLNDEKAGVEDLARVVRAGVRGFVGEPVKLEEFMKVHGETDPNKSRSDVIRLLLEVEGVDYPSDWIKNTSAPFDLRDLESLIHAMEEHEGLQTQPNARGVRDQLQKQTHRKEDIEKVRSGIADLHRAKAAHERQQVERSEKRRKQAAKALYEVVCGTCGKESDPKEGRDVIACAMCQVLVDLGALEHQTAYCNMECMEKGYETHIRDMHNCNSGSECLLLKEENAEQVADEGVVACRACLSDLLLVTLYCSPSCASANLAEHLEESHRALWEKTGAEHGKIAFLVSNIRDYVVSVEELYRKRVAAKIEDKDLTMDYLQTK